ncbi:hypothetical protein YT1_3567 [Rhodococcus ruber]|nr:hypothetical protein YT1_3567 [Rhodococcus ruber]
MRTRYRRRDASVPDRRTGFTCPKDQPRHFCLKNAEVSLIEYESRVRLRYDRPHRAQRPGEATPRRPEECNVDRQHGDPPPPPQRELGLAAARCVPRPRVVGLLPSRRRTWARARAARVPRQARLRPMPGSRALPHPRPGSRGAVRCLGWNVGVRASLAPGRRESVHPVGHAGALTSAPASTDGGTDGLTRPLRRTGSRDHGSVRLR